MADLNKGSATTKFTALRRRRIVRMTDASILELNITDDGFGFLSSIEAACITAKNELSNLEETIQSLATLKPECDKLDYALAASSGALCGLIDIFLVGKPGGSPIENISDKWFSNRTMDFAKLCGWDGKGKDPLSSAISFLERKFKIPYDQRGAGDAASVIFDLNPSNHHFKSLGHNPTLLGLFFSILDQFTNQSHFVSDGELISLQNADSGFELHGKNIPSKLFCGFVNWFGHLVSDVSGSSSSKSRGMGIPSPFWAWTNNIIAIKRQLNLSASKFDKNLNELALIIFKQGYDVRFQTAQAIPVFINEIMVRFLYAIRRMVKYFSSTKGEVRSASAMWNTCDPFSNPTVKRMLTIAHGTFCLIDLGDASIRGFATDGGTFNIAKFFLRLNIVGVGRFTISLYGEARRAMNIRIVESDVQFARREITIVDNYLDGLSLLSEVYDDSNLVDFVDDLKHSDMYIQAFEKTVKLAELRKVPDKDILRRKSDIDSYFKGKAHV